MPGSHPHICCRPPRESLGQDDRDGPARAEGEDECGEDEVVVAEAVGLGDANGLQGVGHVPGQNLRESEAVKKILKENGISTN